MRNLSGAVALVTGAGAGIGAAEVRLLGAKGAQVCAVDIDGDAAGRSGAALAIGADVTDREAMANAIEQVVERFGKLDLVICNAGITHRPATLRVCKPGEAQRVIDVNLIGTLNTVQPAIEPLIASRGHVVVVSSLGWPPNLDAGAMLPAAGGIAYAASKVAVEMLGRGLRLELSPYDVGLTIAYFAIVDTAMARMTIDTPKPKAVDKLGISPEEAAAAVIRAVERGKVRVIIPGRFKILDYVRLFGIHLDNLLLRSKSQRELIRRYDSSSTEARKSPSTPT
jgi:NAD(P)-dependent dehydrogenase (short-subunit alcohol dehydrogenase family)